MRAIPSLLLVTLIAACAPKDAEPTPEAPASEATAASAPAGTPADFAGTWNLTATMDGVADPIQSTMQGTTDFASWTMTLPGRDPVTLEVAMHGDSLVTESLEYESILRAGVMVTVRTASVVKDGMMMGNMVATYRTATGEEKVAGTIHGTRAPE
jgi:hypothetical protein